jgi:hypothetical protein
VWPLDRKLTLITQTYEGVSKSFRTGLLECELQTVRGAIPPLQYVFMAWCLVKRPRREGDHSPESSAKVKNAWMPSLPHTSTRRGT